MGLFGYSLKVNAFEEALDPLFCELSGTDKVLAHKEFRKQFELEKALMKKTFASLNHGTDIETKIIDSLAFLGTEMSAIEAVRGNVLLILEHAGKAFGRICGLIEFGIAHKQFGEGLGGGGECRFIVKAAVKTFVWRFKEYVKDAFRVNLSYDFLAIEKSIQEFAKKKKGLNVEQITILHNIANSV